MIVMKFGGTSVGNADRIRQVIEIVRARLSDHPLVVVSAHSGITDALIEQANKAVAGKHDVSRVIEKHRKIARDLGVVVEGHEELFRDLRDVLRGISLVGEVTPRVLDHVASFGERLSSRTVAAAFTSAGIPAEPIMAYDAGLRTDSKFGRARPLPESDPVIRDFFKNRDRSILPVVTGFIAKDHPGNITTVGRNGSDFSAALFARAVLASEIQIWTDVPGVMTADPRIVKEARPLKTMSFTEAAELAYYGAAVLHPSTLVPAVEANIPVRVLDTSKPGEPGTVILSKNDIDVPTVRAIVHKNHICLLNITTPRMLGHHGFMAKIFESCQQHEIVLDMIATTEVSVSATVEDGQDLEPLMKALSEFAEVTVDRSVATVAVVGHNVGESVTVVDSIFRSLGREQIPVRMISMGARRTNVGLVVDRSHTNRCVIALHSALFQPAGMRTPATTAAMA